MADQSVHFGPVYGRGPSESMALCAPHGATSRTMTRSATITCHRCLTLLRNCNEPDARAAAGMTTEESQHG